MLDLTGEFITKQRSLWRIWTKSGFQPCRECGLSVGGAVVTPVRPVKDSYTLSHYSDASMFLAL